MDRKHEVSLFVRLCVRFITDAVQNSKRVKRRKDQLRVQITRVLELAAEHGCFKDNPICINENGSLGVVFVDYIESVRCGMLAVVQ